MRRLMVALAAISLLATGCPGEADELVAPRVLSIGLDRARPVGDFDTPEFIATISEQDRAALGADQAVYDGDYANGVHAPLFTIDTKFFHYGESRNDVGPCLADDVVVTNVETGQEYVAIPAGHCIENEWVYVIDGAFDYLDE